jgi:hypothetical protein
MSDGRESVETCRPLRWDLRPSVLLADGLAAGRLRP